MSTYDQAVFEARQALSKSIETLSLLPIEQAYPIEAPKERERGLLSSPIAFLLAKKLKKDPQTIAASLAEACNKEVSGKNGLLSVASAAGGYVNFSATPTFYAQSVSDAVKLGNLYGNSAAMAGKEIVVEFSQPNVGKPFHIGHIRSTILGDSISRLLKSQGARVARFNYIGDSGTQVAKLVLALEEFKDMPEAADEKGLFDYYTRIHKAIEENPELSERARQILAKIEDADPQTLQVVSKIRQLSMHAFNRNYNLLGVEFEEITGESLFITAGRKAVEECVEKGIAKKEKDGSVVAELEPHGLPNTILLRSNGTTLYLTRDLGLADYKMNKYHFTDSMIITASEQNMHFRQLQKILTLLGRPYAPVYRHMGFGLVFLSSGRMSTREGRVVFLEDVLNEAIDSAQTELQNRKVAYSQEEVSQIAKTVGIGSTKFAFLRISSERNITFDPSKSTSFEGDTGAYVQYTGVRAKNILRKLGEAGSGPAELASISPEFVWNPSEQNLAQTLSLFPSAVLSAANGYSPHTLCDYLLKLSSDFSTFYENSKVIDPEHPLEQSARALIVKATIHTLEKGLELLGIHVPERM